VGLSIGMMVVGRMAIGTEALGMGTFGLEAFGIEAFGRMALGMEGGGKIDTSPNLCLLTHNQLTTKQEVSNEDLEITLCDDTASKLPGNIGICHYSDNNRSIHRHLCS